VRRSNLLAKRRPNIERPIRPGAAAHDPQAGVQEERATPERDAVRLPRQEPLSGTKADTPKRTQSERIREIWPDLREMILPRRGLLLLGLVLMIINRLSGLVLPYSTRYLIDDVLGKRQVQLLTPLVLAVLAATLVQGVTSFTLTQLLSKAGQRLIAELRQKVQQHVGRLSVGYYDANKSGVLVSRRRLASIGERPSDLRK